MKVYLVFRYEDTGDDIIGSVLNVYRNKADAEKFVADAQKEGDNNAKLFDEKYPTTDEDGFFDDNDDTLDKMTREEYNEYYELHEKVYPFDDFKGYEIKEYELK